MEATALQERIGAASGGGVVCEALTRGHAGSLVVGDVSLVADPGQVYALLGSGGDNWASARGPGG